MSISAISKKPRTKKPRNLAEAEVIRPSEIQAVAGISRVTCWRLEKTGDFPKIRRLSAGASGWLRKDIEAWLAGKAA